MSSRIRSAALVCALGAGCLVSSGCSFSDISLQNTGNKMLNMVGLKPATAAFDAAKNIVKAAESLSREEEYYLGRAVAARILQRYPLLEDRQISDYVRRVGAVAVAFAERPETFGGFHFAVLNTSEVNAMSTPGGFIFVTKGLMDLMPDEDALAAVLAHEVVHVELNHGVKAISQANLNEALKSLGELASSFNCAQVLAQATVVFGAAVDDVFDALVLKGYSRDQELESDRGAVHILNRAGYNPYAMIDMLRGIESAESGSPAGWYSTHPAPSQRISSVQEEFAKAGIQARDVGRGERQQRFDSALRRG